MPAFIRPYGQAAVISGIVLIERDTADFKDTPTLAAGDVQVSTDDGALTNADTLPAVTPAASELVRVSLSAAEMQGDRVVVLFIDQTDPKEWEDQLVIVETDPFKGVVTTGFVNDAGATSSVFITDLAGHTANFFRNSVCTFEEGTLLAQPRRISASSGTPTTITVSPAYTDTVENGKRFTIMGRIE